MSRTGGTTEESIKVKRTRRLPLAERLLPYTPPWILGFLALPVGGLIHWKGSGPLMTVILTVCSGVLTWATYTTWDRRHEHTRTAATVITAGFTGWLVACTSASPATRPMFTTWLIMWVMLSLVWNIRHAGITSANKHDQPSNRVESAWAPIHALKRSRTKNVRTKDGAVEITIQHPGGEATTEDVRANRTKIAGRFAVDDSAVSVSSVPGRADQTRVTVRPDNPTVRVISWPGLSAPGRSVADAPLRIGARADSTPLYYYVTGKDDEDDPRPLPHTLWTGMSGSGKTEAFCVSVLEIRSRTDAVPVVGDPEKFMQSFGDIADAFPIAADGPEQTAQLIRNLPEAIRYRAYLLGKHGYKQWEPECYTKHGIPAVVYHVEEAASVLAKNEDFNTSIRTARSVGISISASMQVAVFRSMPREARAQFGNSLAFGVREALDAKFALLDSTLAAGADPTRWANNHPGRCYGEVVGVDQGKWAMESRVYRVTYAEKRAALEATQPHWAVLDPGTAMRLGMHIDRPDASVLAGTEDFLDPASAEEEDATVRLGKTVVELSTEGRPSTADAREMVLSRIEGLELEGRQTISPADFDQVVTLTGRHRTWIYTELDRLASSGRLERVPGDRREYRIVPQRINGATLLKPL